VHHGNTLRALTRDPAFVEALSHDPETVSLGARSRALVLYALRLTRTPHAIDARDVDALRQVGLDDRGIHDLASVVAYFNFVNRMASGLGVPLEESEAR
jgi:uncharacterized peroxidase-related enzyme